MLLNHFKIAVSCFTLMGYKGQAQKYVIARHECKMKTVYYLFVSDVPSASFGSLHVIMMIMLITKLRNTTM